MKTPVVSILSPTYNHESYIRDCIQSVQAQTFPDWEMIILDDGSSDATLQIARQAAEADERIRVLTQANVGVFRLGETYNAGLAVARGEWIAILEGDDVWLPHKLALQVEIITKYPDTVLTWSRADLIDPGRQVTHTLPVAPDPIPPSFHNQPSGSVVEILLYKAWLPALTLLIRSSALKAIGGFLQPEGVPLVDFPTILSLSRLGPFVFLNEVTGQWRIYPTQTTKRYTVAIHEGQRALLHAFLKENDPLPAGRGTALLRHYDQVCLVAYARSGRYRLVRSEYKAARADYWRAITYPVWGSWVWRLRAAVGFVFSIFRLDVEGLARLLGKKTYTSNK